MDPCGGSRRASKGDEWSAAWRPSRARFIRRGAVAGVGLASGAIWSRARVASAETAPSKAQDEKIFKLALLLEYLQAAFYTEGVSRGALRGDVRSFAETVSEHEREHVAYLRRALGAKAQPRPAFHFGDTTRTEKNFVATAVLLENLGVAAYNGQAANLTKPALAAAAEIVSVEGRHAAWISDLAGRDPAPRAADPGISALAVARVLERTGFIKR